MSFEKIEEVCPKCGEKMIEKRGISKSGKNIGKPYHFFGCSAYPECTHTRHALKNEQKKLPDVASVGNAEILTALKSILKEVNTIANFLIFVNTDKNAETKENKPKN